MIKFKIMLGGRDVPTIYIDCDECHKANVRGLISCVDMRPFVCWNCLKPLPNVMNMVKYKAYRISYCRKGEVPPPIAAGIY